MKIQATIKTEETIEFEVEIPYFCKFSDKLYKVVSDKEAIEIDPSESYTKILKKGLWLCESDVAQGQRIEETEFNEAYHKALFEIGKYVPAPNTDYLDYVESKIEIGEVPLMMQEWKHLNQAIEQ